ncbi:hypothetical protein P280DRAFT_260106 [Massarina eburnea CBS 473.64]|uniref:Uncharacterized protein n=1 Tax=Massarina eburnea CBS 473.64 TaxID=1395130 RepID=A0A6A6RIW5_9PLEO|nr:hypothetical protein P280DRAFT_260106 [Massarina eburnea CBS 473.64]
MESPFMIPREDIEALEGSEGFRLLRNYLGAVEESSHAMNSFCTSHSTVSAEAQSIWLLHRDILHALVMPVVELFKRASTLAEAALCTKNTEDLELAFSGDARSAFLWLQCFLGEEEDWVRTRGCPACVTTETLSTESHVRLTVAASLLSTVEKDGHSTGLSLPPLPHIIPALRDALEADPFWGPECWPYLFSRATQLSGGIQALIASIIDLESLVSSPSLVRIHNREVAAKKGVKLRKSKLAKRQLWMKGEEMDLMRRCALQCWAQAAVPRQVRAEVLGLGKERRARSSTCP